MSTHDMSPAIPTHLVNPIEILDPTACVLHGHVLFLQREMGAKEMPGGWWT